MMDARFDNADCEIPRIPKLQAEFNSIIMRLLHPAQRPTSCDQHAR